MVIAIDIRCLSEKHRTGIGEYTVGFLDALFSIDRENEYILFYNSFKDCSAAIPKWEQKNVQYVALGWPNKIFTLFLFFKIIKLDRLLFKKPDIWFSPTIHVTSLTRSVKHIITIHDLSFEHFPECYSWKRRIWHKFVNAKKQCLNATLILAPSQSTKRDIVESYGVSPGTVHCILPGLSKKNNIQKITDDVKKKYGLSDAFFLFLGTVEPRKNIEGIIEAFKKGGFAAKQYSLIIAGATGWKYEPILHCIEKTPGVRYIGYVDDIEKNSLYRLAKAFIYPSLYEGFGFPVIEALSEGTPVLTSNRSSLPEIAGNEAYLVDPNNTDEITRGMNMLLDTNRSGECTTDSQNILQLFNWKRTGELFLSLL